MKTLLFLILISLFLIGCTVEDTDVNYPPQDEFCGWSTEGKCTSDNECIKGGCSGQVCASTNEEPIMTTCEYLECYNNEKYGVKCNCVNEKCEWV